VVGPWLVKAVVSLVLKAGFTKSGLSGGLGGMLKFVDSR